MEGVRRQTMSKNALRILDIVVENQQNQLVKINW